MAGSQSTAAAEALARGVASALGGVAGVLHRLPGGTWEAVVYGPEPAGLSRRALEGPPAPEDVRASWLQCPSELGEVLVLPLGRAEGAAWGTLAAARLKRGAPEDAFTPEEAALLRQLAEAVSAQVPDPAAPWDAMRWMKATIEEDPSICWLKDAEGRYVYCNDFFLRFCDKERASVIGNVDEVVFPAQQAAFFRAIDRQILTSGKPAITTDKFFIGGKWHVFLACKFPVRDAAGRIGGVAGHVTEIPDEQTSSQALARGEEQLNFITDALPELMSYVDTEGTFRFINRAYEAWFKGDRNAIIGKKMSEFFPPDVYEIIRPHFTEALAGRSNRLDLKLEHADGTLRDVRMTLATQVNFTEKVEGVVVLITDVTDQKLAEERLRFLGDVGGLLAARLEDLPESGAPLKTIAALSVLKLADWCVVELKGADGKLEQLAAAHVDLEKTALLRDLQPWLASDDSLLHLPSVLAGERARLYGEITDRQIEGAIHDPELLMCVREIGLRSAIVVPVTTRAGTIGTIVLAAGPTRRRYDESDLTQAVELARRAALATDNTELFSQKTRAVELRDNFLATASHELRTPLTSLGLHLDALMMEAKVLSKKEPGLSRFQESLNRAMFHSERLGGLIRQLLDVSRLREGSQLDLSREMVDLGKLVKEVTERFSEEASRSSCSLEAQVPAQPVIGYWDPFRLDQVATNLIGNAIKYGAGKPVQVGVSSAADRAFLTVRDRGIGIPPEDQERIFGKFERAVSERHYGGLGLGLWITRQALEAMGGSIRVESTPGVETTFTVELPLQDQPK